jgi:hypothetical protein
MVRIGTPARQWRRLRGMLRPSVRDLRSPLGVPALVRALVAETGSEAVHHVFALPNAFRARIEAFLEHDGFPSGSVSTAPGSAPPWRVSRVAGLTSARCSDGC